MPSPEEILKGSPTERPKSSKKPKQHPKKEEHVDAHDGVDAFPVHPRPFARPIRHAFAGHGRSATVPSGFSLHHRFEGHGRPITGPFFTA